MTESFDLDKVFGNELPDEVLLGGYDDLADGYAVAYFDGLSKEDRKLIHQYGGMYINPLNLTDYLDAYARDYAIQDPERTNKTDIENAHAVVEEIRRYVKLFTEADIFFPELVVVKLPALDRDGRLTGTKEVEGWASLWAKLPHKEPRLHLGQDLLTLCKQVDNFLDDPYGAPRGFNQLQIQEDHARALAEAELQEPDSE